MADEFSDTERRRIELTASARDADSIPKVDGAGEVFDHPAGRVQRMHNGVLIHEGCYHGAWMTEVIRRLRGHHEPQEETAFHALVERLRADTPAPVMVELGSFWGYYALWALQALPGARAVMLEPDPGNLEVGRRNFALNGRAGRFVWGALGRAEAGTTAFTSESDGETRATPVLTLDGLMEREGLDRIDLLLSDVQGPEVGLLEGAARAVAERSVRFWVVSTHHHRITGDALTHQRVLAGFEAVGAHIIAEHSVQESFSGDGLVVASLDPRDRDLRVHVSMARSRDSLFGELEHDLAEALARLSQ